MGLDPILQQALALSPGERVRLIDELLESVVADRSAGELDQAQKAELLRRLAADRADAGAAIHEHPFGVRGFWGRRAGGVAAPLCGGAPPPGY